MGTETVDLTGDEMAVIINLFNSVTGMENTRVLLPIYDKTVEAVKRLEAKATKATGAKRG